eukprot:354554-Chlamydomonas_euryale.AAC.6
MLAPLYPTPFPSIPAHSAGGFNAAAFPRVVPPFMPKLALHTQLVASRTRLSGVACDPPLYTFPSPLRPFTQHWPVSSSVAAGRILPSKQPAAIPTRAKPSRDVKGYPTPGLRVEAGLQHVVLPSSPRTSVHAPGLPPHLGGGHAQCPHRKRGQHRHHQHAADDDPRDRAGGRLPAQRADARAVALPAGSGRRRRRRDRQHRRVAQERHRVEAAAVRQRREQRGLDDTVAERHAARVAGVGHQVGERRGVGNVVIGSRRCGHRVAAIKRDLSGHHLQGGSRGAGTGDVTLMVYRIGVELLWGWG